MNTLKRHILILPLLLICGNIYSQQSFLLSEGRMVEGIKETIPTRDIVETDEGIIVTYELKVVNILKDPLFKNASFVKIDGFGYNCVPAEPCTLFRWDSFVIPNKVGVKVSVIDSSYVDIPLTLAPARPTMYDTEEKGFEYRVEEIQDYEGYFPSNIISETRMKSYRGIPVFDICYNPFKYDCQRKMLRIYTKVTYQLKYDMPNAHNLDDGRIAAYDSFLANTTLNGYTMMESKKISKSLQTTQNPTTPRYIIVSVPAYSNAAHLFAEWKQLLGFDVELLIKSNWTVDELKNSLNYIPGKDNYLLILGDHADIPADYMTITYGNGTTSFYTDYGYVYQEDQYDEIPGIFSGRLPASSCGEAMNMVNKIIEYEKNPTQSSGFYKTLLNCAYFEDVSPRDSCEDRRFVLTSERVRNYMLPKGYVVNRVYNKSSFCVPYYWNDGEYANGGLIPDSLRIGNFNWNGSLSDVKSYINNGALLLLYRGHSLDVGWSNFGLNTITLGSYHFTNAHQYPILLSMTCSSGNFASPNECLIERLLREENGIVGAFGATTSSDTGMNDALAEGIFDAIWPEPGLIPVFPNKSTISNYPHKQEYRLGKILSQAFYKGSATWYHFLPNLFFYHCFGDPSMRVYTELPTEFDNLIIERNANNIYVNVGSNTDATISFYNKYHGTISYEGISEAILTANPDEVVVCISAPNKTPYIDDPSELYYIQNETITGSRTIQSDTIKVGHHVTNLKPQGNVVFDGGTINLVGNDITLDAGTTINIGTKFIIRNE